MKKAVILLACATLASCDQPSEPTREPAATPSTAAIEEVTGNALAEPHQSIMQPAVVNEVEPPPPPPPPKPFEATMLFEAGAALSEAAKTRLAEVVDVAKRAGDSAIVIRGSTDSQGDDAANLRVSRRRAEAVRDYLAGQGIAPERMTVIALGEGRPVAPNVRLDGVPDEEGRRRNRRVDVVVQPGAARPQAAPTANVRGEKGYGARS